MNILETDRLDILQCKLMDIAHNEPHKHIKLLRILYLILLLIIRVRNLLYSE